MTSKLPEKWLMADYELTRYEIEEADELCHGN